MPVDRSASRTRCLVIGGGLLGSHTALELATAGCEVTVLSRSFNPLLEERAPATGISTVVGEVPGAPELSDLIADAGIVYFLAGSSTPKLSDEDAAGSVAGLLEPAIEVLEAMRGAGRTRLVIASSGGTVYGRASALPTPESERTDPISVHGLNSVVMEEYARFYARRHGLEPVILRFSNIYGPAQRSRHGFGVIAAWCEALAQGQAVQLVGDGSIRRDFLHASDAARAARLAGLGELGAGTYNVGSGEAVSLAELLALLGEIAGAEPQVERLPSRPIDVEVTELDSSRLIEATGWSPVVTLRDGLASSWGWYRENHGSERTSSAIRSP